MSDCETDEHEPQPLGTLPTRAELWEQLHHANATAKRLVGTIYYERAHRFINSILDDLEEIRGR
jgi:hypothetical protein